MNKIIAMVQIAAALTFVASCGTSAELKVARDTTYKAPPATLFAAAKEVSEASYKTASSDENALRLQTEPLWYTPEGQLDTTTGNNIARLQEDSINLALVVAFNKADADTFKLDVSPIVFRKHGLSSKPDPVEPSDPSLPGWVGGKAAALQLKIHDRLTSYATATVPPPK